MKKAVMGIMVILFALLVSTAAAQEGVTVPDLTGLGVPEAAAALNRIGLALGAEVSEGWTAESGLEQNRIRAQSVAADQTVPAGTAVDVIVLRSPNTILIYDDNDLTLVNRTGAELDLTGLTFSALDGGTATLAASRWAGALRDTYCAQVWSVGRNGPKGLDDCPVIQNWLVTTNPAEHFWTGAGGTTRFSVTQNGLQRAVCPVANPGRCEFFLPGAAADDVTAYVYFAYTPDRLAIINQSADRWMPLAGTNVYNYFAPPQGAAVGVGDPGLYGRLVNPVASVSRLAPGQCILFTNSSPTSPEPPQPCDIIARLDIGPSVIFWGADFEVDSLTLGSRRTCPAAVAARLTICVMPR